MAWLHLLHLARSQLTSTGRILLYFWSKYQSGESCKNHNWLQRMCITRSGWARSTYKIGVGADFQSSFATLVTSHMSVSVHPLHSTNLIMRELSSFLRDRSYPEIQPEYIENNWSSLCSSSICRVGVDSRPHRDVGYIYVKYITLMHIHFFLKLIIFPEMC